MWHWYNTYVIIHDHTCFTRCLADPCLLSKNCDVCALTCFTISVQRGGLNPTYNNTTCLFGPTHSLLIMLDFVTEASVNEVEAGTRFLVKRSFFSFAFIVKAEVQPTFSNNVVIFSSYQHNNTYKTKNWTWAFVCIVFGPSLSNNYYCSLFTLKQEKNTS